MKRLARSPTTRARQRRRCLQRWTTQESPVDDGGIITDSFIQDVITEQVDGCGGDGCFAMPAGFTLVAFGASAKGASCPTGFSVPSDTVETPSLQANACTCGCNIPTPPSCPDGTMNVTYDGVGSGLCESNGGTMASDGNCNTDGFMGTFSAKNEHRYTPPDPTGGESCQAPANKDSNKLTYAKQGRVCRPRRCPRAMRKSARRQPAVSFSRASHLRRRRVSWPLPDQAPARYERELHMLEQLHLLAHDEVRRQNELLRQRHLRGRDRVCDDRR